MNYETTTIREFLFKYRKYIIMFSVLAVVLLIIYYLTPSSKRPLQKVTNSPSPTGEAVFGEVLENKNNNDQAFFINQITTNKIPVTGFSWKGDKNIYSTPDGIYEAGTNTPIVNDKIKKIVWSDNFNSLFLTSDTWKKLDYKNKTSEAVGVTLQNPTINNDGTRIADFKLSTLYVYKSSDYTSSQLKFNEPIEKVLFSKSGGKIVVFTNYATKSYFYLLDENLKIEKVYNSNDDYILSSFSPTGDNIAITLNNKLQISDFVSLKGLVSFSDKSSLITGFRNNNEIVVVEKYKDTLGRTLDNIYINNLSGKSTRISDSKPMIDRINFSIPISFNNNGYIATFGENNGKTWILSLKPNLFPTYSVDGELVYSNLKPMSH